MYERVYKHKYIKAYIHLLPPSPSLSHLAFLPENREQFISMCMSVYVDGQGSPCTSKIFEIVGIN